MSIHFQLTTEAAARLQRQRRNSTISSIVVALLVMVLIGVVLGLFLLPKIENEEVVIVTYSYEQVEEKPEKKQPKETVKMKPSAPSSSVAKVIASTAVSNISIPVPEIEVTTPSIDFGASDDFGSGWGSGSGSGSGSASFFNTKIKAERVVYVIDFSLSMKGERDRLMREELTKSLAGLSKSIQYQLIFFSGPCWFAGDKATQSKVVSGDKEYRWEGDGWHDSTPLDGLPSAKWLKVSDKQIEGSIRHIQDTPLVGGTAWEPALQTAMENMNPKPDIIFFMTDGAAGKDSMNQAAKMAKLAKKEGIIINTVALMEAKVKGPLIHLAKETGGKATYVSENGEARPLVE